MADEYEETEGGSAGEEWGSTAQLESSETLGAPVGATEEGYTPPDRPVVSEQDDMTARGMHEGETLDERLRREEPDPAVDDAGFTGDADAAETAAIHVVDDGAGLGETEPAVDPAAVADRAADAEVERAGDDDAARIDALRDAAGAAAPASGRTDAGDLTGL